MDVVGLKLILSAEIKNLEKAMQEVERSTGRINGALSNLTATTENFTGTVNQAAPATNTAAESINNMGTAAQSSQESLENLSASTSQVGDAAAEVSSASEETEGALAGTSEALSEATGSAEDFVGGLLGSAGLAVATAIATDLVMKFAFSGLELQDVLEGHVVAFSDAEKAQFAWNQEMASSNAKAQAEINTLETLINIVKDAASTKQQQADAIKVINDKYPEYLSNLKAEKINSESATTAIGKQVELMLIRSKVVGAQQAYEKALGKQADAAVEVEQKKLEAQREAAELASGQSNFLKEQVKLFRDVGNAVREYGIAPSKGFSIVEKAEKDLNDANTLVGVFKKNLDDIINEASGKGLLDKILGKDGGSDTVAKIRSVSDVLKDLQVEMKTIQDRAALVGTGVDELANQRLQALNKAFDELSKMSGPAARKTLEDVAQQINTVSAAVLGVEKISTKQIFTFSKQKVRDNEIVGGKAKDVIALELPVRITLSELEPGIKAAQQKLSDGIKTITDIGEAAWDNGLSKLNERINQILKDVVIGIGVAELENAGAALAGGAADFVGVFLNVVAVGLEQLGKLLLEYGLALLAFNVSLKSLNPYVAIAAGGAAYLAAGAFKAKAKGGIKSYAVGGITDGPTLAMVGDNPSGREAMIPEELWPYLGGGSSPIYVENHIDAQGLVTIVKRGMREEGRVR